MNRLYSVLSDEEFIFVQADISCSVLHDRQKIVAIGSVWFDTKGDTIAGEFVPDTTVQQPEAHTVSMFISDVGRFNTPDPLAEKYYHISPDAYCGNNPIRFVDPDGRNFGDFWDQKGRLLGNDGINDGKVYVMTSTPDTDAASSFVKDNSGNVTAFEQNGIAYDNSIEIVGSPDARQAMVNEVSKDNGKGGTKDSNNREYGGSVVNNTVTTVAPGQVVDPSVKSKAEITLPAGVSTFHSHPSGSKSITTVQSSSSSSTGSVSTYGATTTTTKTHYFTQTPSDQDINSAGSNTHYVFGRSGGEKGTVYIYTSNGVQATLPMKYFVNPKTSRR